jgi:hypothetical protein
LTGQHDGKKAIENYLSFTFTGIENSELESWSLNESLCDLYIWVYILSKYLNHNNIWVTHNISALSGLTGTLPVIIHENYVWSERLVFSTPALHLGGLGLESSSNLTILRYEV